MAAASETRERTSPINGQLAIGDEVTTTGGIVGKITRLNDDLITLKVAENVEINLQKAAVSSVLPKGTMKS